MDILCVGQLVLDILCRPVASLPEDTDTQIVETIEMNCGGDGLNVAMNLARLGEKIAMVGRVGQDGFGAFLRQRMEAAGVDIRGLISDGEGHTDACVALIDAKGDRNFLYAPGVNRHFTAADVADAQIPEEGLLHIGGTFLLPGLDGEGTAELFRRAHARGSRTSMDATHDASGRWMELIRPCLPHLDVFLPSEMEARSITRQDKPEAMAEVLLAAGVKTVIIKLGEQGCYVTDGQEAFFQAAYPVRAVDTTGAGDAFVAGFLHGRAQGHGIRECARIGCAAGAITVQSVGANTPALSREAIARILRA